MHLGGGRGQRLQGFGDLDVEGRDVAFDGALTGFLADLLLALLGFEPPRGHRIFLEDGERLGETANLVGPAGADDRDIEVAAGELGHFQRHAPQRLGDLAERDPAKDGESQQQADNGADHEQQAGGIGGGDARVARGAHGVGIDGDELPHRRDRGLAMLGRDIARIGESVFHLAGDRQFEHLGAGFPAIPDRGPQGVDQLALLGGGGDGRQAIDRIQRGIGGLAIGFDVLVDRLAVGAGEDDVLFADRGAVEIALGLQAVLHPHRVAIDQAGRRRGQVAQRHRGLDDDPDRDKGDDRGGHRDLGNNGQVLKSGDHSRVSLEVKFALPRRCDGLRTARSGAAPRRITPQSEGIRG